MKLITKVALTRFGVLKFTEEVNAAFADGWRLCDYFDITIKKKGVRIICKALLTNEPKKETKGCCE